MKLGTSFVYFSGNHLHSAADDVNNGSVCQEGRILIKKLYELKGYETKRLMKEFHTKGWKKTTTLRDFSKHLKRKRTFFSKITHLLVALVTSTVACPLPTFSR